MLVAHAHELVSCSSICETMSKKPTRLKKTFTNTNQMAMLTLIEICKQPAHTGNSFCGVYMIF